MRAGHVRICPRPDVYASARSVRYSFTSSSCRSPRRLQQGNEGQSRDPASQVPTARSAQPALLRQYLKKRVAKVVQGFALACQHRFFSLKAGQRDAAGTRRLKAVEPFVIARGYRIARGGRIAAGAPSKCSDRSANKAHRQQASARTRSRLLRWCISSWHS